VRSEDRSPRLAVLIDADNASAKIADGLFEEIAKIGEASVRRIYGDFSNPRSKAWADTPSKHAIIPQQQFAYTTGKNASDITLVIDAMDLLHSGRFDGFCLVSSDSDFTGSRPAFGSKASMCLVLASRKRPKASVRRAADLCTPRT
jgi:NYN domain